MQPYFNPRTHEGCDVGQVIYSPNMPAFQSTHPRGVRHKVNDCVDEGIRFQSTHPRGVRLLCHCGTSHSSGISIHAPTRGATLSFLAHQHRRKISIHAPTRGATSKQAFIPRYNGISIHAPTRGATCLWPSRRCPSLYFNPRTHEGCDARIIDAQIAHTGISIHAPTRGATSLAEYVRAACYEFQSTHPRGVRRRG